MLPSDAYPKTYYKMKVDCYLQFNSETRKQHLPFCCQYSFKLVIKREAYLK